MRIATVVFLLAVLVLAAFSLNGGLVNELKHRNEEISFLKQQLADLANDNQQKDALIKEGIEKYQVCQAVITSQNVKISELETNSNSLNSRSCTTQLTPEQKLSKSQFASLTIIGGIMIVMLTALGYTSFRKVSIKDQRNLVITKNTGKPGQTTITMNPQTYADFQKFLKNRSK